MRGRFMRGDATRDRHTRIITNQYELAGSQLDNTPHHRGKQQKVERLRQKHVGIDPRRRVKT